MFSVRSVTFAQLSWPGNWLSWGRHFIIVLGHPSWNRLQLPPYKSSLSICDHVPILCHMQLKQCH